MEITVELDPMKVDDIVHNEMLYLIDHLNVHLSGDAEFHIFSRDKKEEERKVKKLRKAAMMIANYYS